MLKKSLKFEYEKGTILAVNYGFLAIGLFFKGLY